MNRMLTDKIKAEMLNFGMDLVGFGPVDRWKNAPYLLSPQAILPEAKTVIVGAIHITDTWSEMGGEPGSRRKPKGKTFPRNANNHMAIRYPLKCIRCFCVLPV